MTAAEFIVLKSLMRTLDEKGDPIKPHCHH